MTAVPTTGSPTPPTVMPNQPATIGNEASALFDPEVVALIAATRAAGLPVADPQTMPVARARKYAERYHKFVSGDLPPVRRAETLTLPGPIGDFSLRIVYPDAGRRDAGPYPVVVWLHGGGFVLNGITTHERLFRLLALRSGAAVIGIGYSRAPEHRFPVQYQETTAALAWLRDFGWERGLDGGRIVLGGDSAGANLALSAAIGDVAAARPVTGLALLYGMYAPDFQTASHQQFGDGRYGLSTARMRWYWQQYLGDTPVDHPVAVPMHADLSALPPTLLVGAGLDCLLDDTLQLAEYLADAGVETDLSVYPSLPHSFALMTARVQAADGAVTRIAAHIARLLNAAVPVDPVQ